MKRTDGLETWDHTCHAAAEIEVEFQRKGYFKPAKLRRDADDCEPPEGEDERTILTVTVGGNEIDLKALAKRVYFGSRGTINAIDTIKSILENELFQPIVDDWSVEDA